MKKFNKILALLLSVSILLLSGCSLNNGEPESDVPNIENEVFEGYISKNNAVLDKKDNKETYQTKIKKQYPEKEFFDKGLIYRFYFPIVSFQHYLFTVEDMFPAECLRETSKNTAYTIYKTQENGLVYLFYQKEFDYWILHHSVYVKKSLSSSDFESVKAGDSLERIGEIDPAAISVKNYSEYPTTSIHLLKDGVAKIDYKKNDDGAFVVSGIKISKDFKLKSEDFGSSGDNIIYDFTILAQDYIE